MSYMNSLDSLQLKAVDTSVFILAAGRGERMRPLTDSLPKPLLKVGDQSLLEHHLTRLQKMGFQHIIINIAHLGEKIQHQIGNGANYGLCIEYSDERDTGALETAGGIGKALNRIRSDYFLCLNADIWTDFNFLQLLTARTQAGTIVLVNNPPHNNSGDFAVSNCKHKTQPLLAERPSPRAEQSTYTFSGIGLYAKTLFTNLPAGKQRLAPLLFQATDSQQLDALIHQGTWLDIGTPQRLTQLNAGYSAINNEKTNS